MSEPLSSPPPAEPSKGPWLGLGIGAVLVLAIVGYLVYSSRSSDTRYERRAEVMQSSGPADAYAERLKVSDIKLYEAENFVGGKAMYIEGKVANSGDKTVIGSTVEITFKNSLHQVVQRENHNLMVIHTREPAVDIVALSALPLKPGDSREFRLTFERVSADWNGQYPEVKVKLVNTQ